MSSRLGEMIVPRRLLGAAALSFGSFLVGAITAVLFHGTLSLQWARFWLDVLRTLLSWPVAILVLVLAFFVLFQVPIALLLREAGEFALPWLHYKRRPQEPSVHDAKPPTEEEERISQIVQEAKNTAEATTRGVLKQLPSQLEQQRKEAEQWWLRYLDAFLQPETKEALRWIADRPEGVLLDEFNAKWRPEWKTLPAWMVAFGESIGETLIAEHLISREEDERLHVTDAGERFLTYEKDKRKRLAETARRIKEHFADVWMAQRADSRKGE